MQRTVLPLMTVALVLVVVGAATSPAVGAITPMQSSQPRLVVFEAFLHGG